MRIMDVFSYLPERELSIEQIKGIVTSLENGESRRDDYSLEKSLPENANENEVNCSKDLISEGQRVCYLLRGNRIIAVIGYK